MNKRKGESPKPLRRSSRQNPNTFYTPFRELDQLFERAFSTDGKHSAGVDPFAGKHEPPPTKIGIQPPDDDSLFQTAMTGVSPLPSGPSKKVPVQPVHRDYPRFLAMEQIEAYTQLVDLVAGEGHFELSSSDEYIDGAVLGISPEILKNLREGYFSYQDYLDLHGLNRQEARSAVRDFIMECFAARRRCVLIIAGERAKF